MTRHDQYQDTGDGSDGRGEVAGQDLPAVSTEPDRGGLADLARGALEDQKARKRHPQPSAHPAGSKVWRTREPRLAQAVLDLMGEPASRSRVLSMQAMHAGEVRLLQEEIARLHGELRDLRFERDRMRIAYAASHELAGKILAECSDPKHVDNQIRVRLAELAPADREW